MSYAYADSVVFLEELASEAHPMVHDLCGMHAGQREGAAVGWDLP